MHLNLNLSVVQKGKLKCIIFLVNNKNINYLPNSQQHFLLHTQVIFKIITLTRQSGSKEKKKVVFTWTSA